jgi:predicted nucleotidyltransferase component of viral defense system
LEQTYLPIQSRSLIHPYSDAAQCGAHIRCHKLEEILASKLTTLLFRRKAQDLFDLIFSIFSIRHLMLAEPR